MKKTQAAKTPFKERTGEGRGWLGNSRWQRIPAGGFPGRSRCQEVVTADERAAADKLLSEFEQAQQTEALNNIHWRTCEIDRLERMGPSTAAQAEELRRQRSQCDHKAFVEAQTALRTLRQEASTLATTILMRLVDSFDAELNEAAAIAERRLMDLGIELFEDRMVDSYPCRHWTLWDDAELVALHARREIARNRANWLAKTCDGTSEIGYLGTDQTEYEHFSWL